MIQPEYSILNYRRLIETSFVSLSKNQRQSNQALLDYNPKRIQTSYLTDRS